MATITTVLFTDFSPTEEVKYKSGWIMCGVIVLSITVNMSIVMYINIMKIYLVLKKWYQKYMPKCKAKCKAKFSEYFSNNWVDPNTKVKIEPAEEKDKEGNSSSKSSESCENSEISISKGE